jgi:hypothetical protein
LDSIISFIIIILERVSLERKGISKLPEEYMEN